MSKLLEKLGGLYGINPNDYLYRNPHIDNDITVPFKPGFGPGPMACDDIPEENICDCDKTDDTILDDDIYEDSMSVSGTNIARNVTSNIITNTYQTSRPKGSDVKIILGTAHLASTPGKRSPDGQFREYKYSREICEAVKTKLCSYGYDCDIDFSGDDMPRTNSSQELVKRIKAVNELCTKYGSSKVIYVSIHVNAASNDGKWHNATGWSIYTSKGKTNSDKLASCIYDAAYKTLGRYGKSIRTDFSDGDADFEENFYVLSKSNCVAVLTENFFQDTKSDVEWLVSPEGRSAITELHVNGIIKYLESL